MHELSTFICGLSRKPSLYLYSRSTGATFSDRPSPFHRQTIENRTVPCINGAPHDFSVLYVSLHDLVKHVFPKVPVRSFQEILAVLGIYVFKASP